jgi:hypothetical protein
MEQFTLRFGGHVPSGARGGKAEEKHNLRVHFSDQIHRKWQKIKALNQYLEMHMPIVEDHRSGRFCKPSNGDELLPFFGVKRSGLTIFPMISAHNALMCELSIFMSVMEPRLLEPKGDLDNRVKFIFDALRMPHEDQEIPASACSGSDQLYCLLEDDSLIRKFSVEAEEAISSPLTESIEIRVTIFSTSETHFSLGGL